MKTELTALPNKLDTNPAQESVFTKGHLQLGCLFPPLFTSDFLPHLQGSVLFHGAGSEIAALDVIQVLLGPGCETQFRARNAVNAVFSAGLLGEVIPNSSQRWISIHRARGYGVSGVP